MTVQRRNFAWRVSFFGWLFLSQSALATTPNWTPPAFSLGSLDINGSLNQKIRLGRLSGSREFAFPIHLEHGIRIDEPVSDYKVSQLVTYVAPEGRESILWIEPGGIRHLFKTKDILEKEPQEDNLPEDRWTAVSGRIGDYRFLSPAGWIYQYKAGAIGSLTAPTGRVLRFETNGVHIARIFQEGEDGGKDIELLTAGHDDFGLLKTLKIGLRAHRFEYDEVTEQLAKWFPAGSSGGPVEFEYLRGLIFLVKLPGGDEMEFHWGDKRGDWQEKSGLKLPERESPAAFLISDNHFSYRYGINKNGINLVRTTRIGDLTDAVIWNPKTKQMIVRNRDGGEVTRFFGVRGAESGRLETVRDAEGREALNLKYDEKGRVIWRKTLGRPPRTFVYDHLDRIVEIRRLERRERLYEYDGDSERPTKVKNALGDTVEYRFNDLGQLVSIKGIEGDEHHFKFDELGRLIEHAYPYDYTESWKHDEFGRVTESKGLNGKILKKEFSQDGKRLEAVHSGDATWQYEFDPDGSVSRLLRNGETWQQVEREQLAAGPVESPNVAGGLADDTVSAAISERITSIDPTGAKTVLELDAGGKVKKEINALGQETQFRHDELGRLKGWTDARNVIADFERDAIGRVTGLENAEGAALGLRYDKTGRIRERNTGERNIKYEYDREGRLTRIDYGAPGEWVTREYDEYGRIKVGATAEVVTRYDYDDLDRVVKRKETILGEVSTTLEYEWTPAGKKAARTIYRNGEKLERTDYRYDLLGRYQSIAVDGEVAVSYAYDPETLRLAQKEFTNGMIVHYGWDENGRPALLKAVEKEGAVTKDVSYQWSDHGKLNVRIMDGVQENYYYDKLGRLVSVIRNTLEEIAGGASVLPDPQIVSEMGIEIQPAQE